MNEKPMGLLREYTYQLQLFTEMKDPNLQGAFLRTSKVALQFGFRLGGILGTLVGGVLVGLGMLWVR